MGWHDSTISTQVTDAQTGTEAIIAQRLHENDEVPSFASRPRASPRGAAVK
jgi:hypothetical protein